MSAKPKKCPKCGAGNIAKLLYGMPSSCNDNLNKKLDASKIILGGCVMHTDKENPQWHCNSCNHEWGKSEVPDFGEGSSTPPENPKNQDPPRY